MPFPATESGPTRVLPGRLSVSRTFGDAEAKIESLGGKPGVIIARPEIRTFEVEEADFLMLCSDGVFDRLESEDVVRCVHQHLKTKLVGKKTVHEECGMAVEEVIKLSLERKSFDNVTAVLVAFPGFKRRFKTRMNRILAQKKHARTQMPSPQREEPSPRDGAVDIEFD